MLDSTELAPYQLSQAETKLAQAIEGKFGKGSVEHNETLCVLGKSIQRFYNTKPNHLQIIRKLFESHGVKFPA
ncbi:hypothetical protein JNK62_02245 [bacterium]|nr:hypothetical protein [bacterium]